MKTTMTRGAAVFGTLLLSAMTVQAAELLAAQNGMTLYTFDNDKDGVSACYDACAVAWPPYLGKEGDAMMTDWTMVKRTDGAMQWAYDGKPLYFFKDDAAKGDMKGDGLKGVWHVINE
jgi:predicted lipoprotein with Yx(FWY)xxD motif